MASNPFKGLLNLIQKRFLKTSAALQIPSSPDPSSSSFTVQYLTGSCGFPFKTALSISKTLQLQEKNSQKYESLLQFLKSQGFSDTHLVKLITKRPFIFQCRVDKKLKPKFQYLISIGFAGSLLPELILANPIILRRSLGSKIKPTIDFLREYLDTNEKLVTAIMRASWLLTSDLKGRMQANIDLLISERIPIENISKILLRQPRVILQKVDRVVSAVKAVKELGLQPESAMFAQTFRVMVSMSDSTWKRKHELFKNLGWSDNEIMFLLKCDAHCFALSEEKIKDAVNFYINTLKLERKFITSYPKVLNYSIEKRVRPRYDLFQLLLSKELIQSNRKFEWVLMEPENRFMKNYVSKHLKSLPNIVELYCSSIKAKK